MSGGGKGFEPIAPSLLLFSLLLSLLELSDTKVYEPYIRARLGTAAHFVVLKLRTVPNGTALGRQGLRAHRPVRAFTGVPRS